LAEVTNGMVRIARASDSARVMGTLEVVPGRILRLTVFGSVLASDPGPEAEVHELIVGEVADGVVRRIESLISAEQAGFNEKIS
jgi:hypothetical protein